MTSVKGQPVSDVGVSKMWLTLGHRQQNYSILEFSLTSSPNIFTGSKLSDSFFKNHIPISK